MNIYVTYIKNLRIEIIKCNFFLITICKYTAYLYYLTDIVSQVISSPIPILIKYWV